MIFQEIKEEILKALVPVNFFVLTVKLTETSGCSAD